jgi:cytosine/adenosine deaminase-related metal-dependent hydrolase
VIETAVTGGTVVTVDAADRIHDPGWVLIRDARITGVGADEVPRPAADVTVRRVIDARGAVVMPGLVQSHVHLCQTLFRNMADDLELLDWLRTRVWPLEGAHDERTMAASARLGIAELLRGGTTAIQDMGSVHHYDAVFQAAKDAGLRLVGGKCMMDAPDGVPAALHETTAAALESSAGLAERWHDTCDGRLRYAYAPRFALSCTEELLRATCRHARDARVRLHTHASENRAELAAVRAATGRDNLQYLNDVGLTGEDVSLAHCVHVDAGGRALLARTGTHVAHCPGSNLKLASGIADVPALLAAGVRVSLGADGAPCNNNLDGFMEMRLCALLHKPGAGPRALPARQVLRLATMGGAAALGIAHEVGSIEKGKRADLILVDQGGVHTGPGGDVSSRLVYATRASDVRTVLVDGAVMMQDHHFLTLDEARVNADAKVALAVVMRRAGLTA